MSNTEMIVANLADAESITLEAAEWLNGLATFERDSINTAITFEELIAAAEAEGLTEADLTFVGSPYEVLDGPGKAVLVDTPFFVRWWRYAIDRVTERPYVVLYLVTRDNRMFILTDGSTGIFAQLRRVTGERIGAGLANPNANLMAANGLRFSEYGVTAEGKPAKPGDKVDSLARTYYLA